MKGSTSRRHFVSVYLHSFSPFVAFSLFLFRILDYRFLHKNSLESRPSSPLTFAHKVIAIRREKETRCVSSALCNDCTITASLASPRKKKLCGRIKSEEGEGGYDIRENAVPIVWNGRKRIGKKRNIPRDTRNSERGSKRR